MALIEGEFTRLPDNSWKDRLRKAQAKWESAQAEIQKQAKKRTIPAFLNFCEEVHAFRKSCGPKKGGTTFTKLGREWLGADPSQLSRWDAVGKKVPELVGAPTSLPASEDSIARIASLDDIAFAKALPQLQPDMKREEVRQLIKDIQPQKPEPTKEEQEEKLTKKRERLYKAFMDLPEKHQFVLGRAIYSHVAAKGWAP